MITSSDIATAAARISGHIRRIPVLTVEPELAPTLNRALAEGPGTEVDVGGIAANALGARRIGGICYGLASSLGTESVLVSETAIATAQAMLWRELRVFAEPAGATALAALTSGAYCPSPGERIAHRDSE